MTRIAFLAAVLPAIAFAQQPPANDDVERPAEVTQPATTPPPTR